MLGDIPEPAVLARNLNNEGRSFSAAGIAIGSFPVRPECGFLEHRIPIAEVQPVHDHRALTAGIDDDLGPHFLLRAVLPLDIDSYRSFSLPNNTGDMDAFFHGYSVFLGISQHHFIELAADDLPGLRRL